VSINFFLFPLFSSFISRPFFFFLPYPPLLQHCRDIPFTDFSLDGTRSGPTAFAPLDHPLDRLSTLTLSVPHIFRLSIATFTRGHAPFGDKVNIFVSVLSVGPHLALALPVFPLSMCPREWISMPSFLLRPSRRKTLPQHANPQPRRAGYAPRCANPFRAPQSIVRYLNFLASEPLPAPVFFRLNLFDWTWDLFGAPTVRSEVFSLFPPVLQRVVFPAYNPRSVAAPRFLPSTAKILRGRILMD